MNKIQIHKSYFFSIFYLIILATYIPGRDKETKIAVNRPPMEIRLELSESLRLQATLINHSSVTRPYLHTRFYQQCKLNLMPLDKEPLIPFDYRSRSVPAPLQREHFKFVDSGDSVSLQVAEFIAKEAQYEITWGPFRFQNVPPGRYRAQVEWESHRDFPESAGIYPDWGGGQPVWKGNLHSNEVIFTLP